MMTMSEMKNNDTMQKTENMMDDASECVPLAPAPPMRTGALTSPAILPFFRRICSRLWLPVARRPARRWHVLLKRPPLRSPYHALLLGSP